MKATELRIGNWVINDCNDSYLKIDAGCILTAAKDDTWLLPITITHDILEAAGLPQFEPNCYDLGVYWFDVKHKEMGCWLIENGTPIARNIKYLHQLQNVFFFLGGTELDINL
jgi:hypothetical protein